MPDSEITTGRILLVEYERLKEEQKARIGFRDNLIYATLGAMAGVIAAVLQADRADLLLLMPPVSLLLGWTYLINDQKTSAIGRYIRGHLVPRLAALGSVHGPVFGWEEAHRSDRYRSSRKIGQLGVDLLAFALSPLVAVLVCWTSGSRDPLLVLLSVAELAGVGAMAWQIIRYADLLPARPL